MPRSWDDLFKDPQFHWSEPDPDVMAVAARWREQGRRKVFDLGCGAGRHLAYLAAQGFEVWGLDNSPNGLAECARRLGEARLTAQLVQADMSEVPWEDESFDTGIAVHVLNHGSRAALQQAIDEVWRVLRPEGEFYLTAIGTGDWRFGKGEQIEPDSFVPAEGPEAGILHHFFTEEELRDWLAAFGMLELKRDRAEMTGPAKPAGPPVFRDGWTALLRK